MLGGPQGTRDSGVFSLFSDRNWSIRGATLRGSIRGPAKMAFHVSVMGQMDRWNSRCLFWHQVIKIVE